MKKNGTAPGPTVKDLSAALDAAILKGGRPAKGVLFRPTAGQGFVELDYALVRASFDEIARKIPLVEAGLGEFSATEKVMFMLFIEHAKLWH